MASRPNSQLAVQIRPATVDDWSVIWPFFFAIVAGGESYAYPTDLTSDQARDLWMETPPSFTVVATFNDVVVGSAKMGPNRGGRGAHVATASFMVDPGAQGNGVGRALGEYMIAWADNQGYRSIQFNAVVATNSRAVRLWQDLGFEIIGTVPEAFEHPRDGYVGLHVMHRSLT